MKNIKKINLYILILLSILVFVYIFIVVGNKMDSLEGYENEATSPSKDAVKEMALYTVPLLPIYLIVCIYFLKKGTALKSLSYPVMLGTCFTILITIGVALNGQAFMWLLIFGLPLMMGGLIFSLVMGILQDTSTTKKG